MKRKKNEISEINETTEIGLPTTNFTFNLSRFITSETVSKIVNVGGIVVAGAVGIGIIVLLLYAVVKSIRKAVSAVKNALNNYSYQRARKKELERMKPKVIEKPVEKKEETQHEAFMKNIRIKETISLCSPMVLYTDATATIIDPMRKTTRSFILMGPMEEILSSRFQNPLSLAQSMIVVFPHIMALVAITLICFAISYLIFMLQEIRT